MNEPESRVRIESRFKRRDVPCGEMQEMLSNPLDRLFILQSKSLQSIAQQMGSPALAVQLPKIGIGAVKNLPAKKKLLSLISDQSPDWWQPEKFGGELLGMLKLLEPANLYKMLGGCQ